MESMVPGGATRTEYEYASVVQLKVAEALAEVSPGGNAGTTFAPRASTANVYVPQSQLSMALHALPRRSTVATAVASTPPAVKC
jgi:hypothetical protein